MYSCVYVWADVIYLSQENVKMNLIYKSSGKKRGKHEQLLGIIHTICFPINGLISPGRRNVHCMQAH